MPIPTPRKGESARRAGNVGVRPAPDGQPPAMLGTTEAWARLLRGQRHVGDFTRWKDHDAYQKALERLLRDLKVAAGPVSDG